VPFLLLDFWVSLYQAVCFPIYGIDRVRRSDYIALDRKKLAYGLRRRRGLQAGAAGAAESAHQAR
jgi:hypothetical protein